MTSNEPRKPKTEAERREERRAAELRANLQRRKAQIRARRKGSADESDGLPALRGEASPAD